MNKNKLIIASAGSGKTTYLVNEALRITESNILITTFTETNEEEIKRKFIEKNGAVPGNIVIQTWFSFLLQHGVRPYQDVMNDELNGKKIGFFLVEGRSGTFKTKDGKIHHFKKDNFYANYFTSKESLKINSDMTSKFICECNIKVNGELMERISRIYPYIFIDEVQDLAGWDLEILRLLFQSNSRILLVGDPRQGTYSTNNSAKHGGYKKTKITHFFEEFNDLNKKENLLIDESSLAVSYRCNQGICDLSNQLFPDLKQTQSIQKDKISHDGIFLVKKVDIDEYLKRYPDCLQLRDNISTKDIKKGYKVMNFGSSKGLTFERVLIFPTGPIINWLKDRKTELAPTSRSKFYVAITRAKYSVGIVYDYNEDTDLKGIKKYNE